MKISLLGVLKENDESQINEQGAAQLVKGFVGDSKAFESFKPGVSAAFNDVLKFAKNDKNQIVGLTAKSPNQAVVINNMDDLLHALKVKGGLTAEVLAKFNQGLLKSSKTPIDLIDGITKEVVGSTNFVSRYGKLTDSEMRKTLKAAGYSDNAVESFMKNSKLNPAFKKSFDKAKLKRTQSGKNKKMSTKGNGSNVPPAQKKTLIERSKELINMITVKKSSWAQLLKWGVPLGISALALWWWLYDSDVVPDDTPETEPGENGDWAPCIQELLTSKEGAIAKTSNGQLSVIVKPTDFPGGLQFYNNGRVMDVVGKKMGTWKCKGTKAVIAETQKISLIGLLNEQGGEVDVKTMTDYVNVAINDLDGFVDTGNLTSLLDTLKKLNGKTFQGKNAISGFLSLYKDLESGDDFIADVNSVGVATLDAVAVLAKREIIALAKSGGSATTPKSNTGGKKGLGSIDIIWDGQKNTGDKSTGGGTKKSKYHDCSGKDTFEFGCKAPKIKEIQICLGMEQRYQTGNFGPLTKKALEDMSYDTSKGITVEMYNRIKSTCSGDSNKPRLDGSIEPLKTNLTPKMAPVNTDNLKMPNIQPVTNNNPSGEQLYKLFQGRFETRNEEGNEGDSYLFQEGNRIKYKGDALSQENLNLLSGYISSLGYDFMKAKPKEDYEFKYVWLKR